MRLVRRVSLTIVAICALLALFGVTASAQTTDANQITLGISPQLLDLTANPGEQLKATFRLTNASDQEITVKATPKNFTPRGEEGAVDLTEDRTDFSLADWVNVTPETTKIAARATQDFEVLIDVPPTVEPGSHYGSVVFATIPPEQEGAGAVVSQEIAPVILVKVAGDVIETVEIEEFTSNKSFYSNENVVTLFSRLKNTGNVHFKPTGKIVIKNMFGRVVAELQLDQRNVLPNSIRQIPTDWQLDGFTMGRYTAELTIVYGDQVTIRNASTSFIIFPYQTIVPLIVLVLLISLILYKGRRRIAKAYQALRGSDEQTKKK